MPSNSLLESKYLNNLKLEGLVKTTNKESIVLSYANNMQRISDYVYTNELNNNNVSYSDIKHLVIPNTDTVSEGFINCKGTDFNQFFEETYTILYKNSTIVFGSLYINKSDKLRSTTDTTITFPVVSANGIFEGAKEVIIEYTSNEYKSRIITINF